MEREYWEYNVHCPICRNKMKIPKNYSCNHFRCNRCKLIWNIYKNKL